MLHLRLPPRVAHLGGLPRASVCHSFPFPFPFRVFLLQSHKFLSTSPLIRQSTLPLLRSRTHFHHAFRIHRQLRTYTSNPRKHPTVTSFPQYTPRKLKPLHKNTAFWTGIGFLSLLIWSPIPGWVLLAGISYGFYRLFRTLRRARDAIFSPHSIPGLSSSSTSFLDKLFTQDPRTREIAAKIQEMSMDRVERAIELDEEGIRGIFPTAGGRGESGEFHFSFPNEVSMVDVGGKRNVLEEEVVDISFEMKIRFMVYLASTEGRKGAEVVAWADVVDEGVALKKVEVRGARGRRVVLKGRREGDEEEVDEVDESGVGKGEGEGKTIDATKWTSR